MKFLPFAALISLVLLGCGGGGGSADPIVDPIDQYVGTWTRCDSGSIGATSYSFTLKIDKQTASQASVELRSSITGLGCTGAALPGPVVGGSSTMQLTGGTKTVEGRRFDKAVFTSGTASRKELIGVDGRLWLSFYPESNAFAHPEGTVPRDAEGYPEGAGLNFVRATVQ